jgi:hypothetical protein
MSQNQIEDKIKTLLTKGVESEAEVVYLLVEVRKLMDRVSYSDPDLRMFCNWAVHPDLSHRQDGSTNILKEFDDALIREIDQGAGPLSIEHCSFKVFRERLDKFIKTFQFLEQMMSDAIWPYIATEYCNVVNESPITFNASKADLKYLSSAQIERQINFAVRINGIEVPSINWRLKLKDGTTRFWTMTLETISRSGLKRMERR